MLARQTWVVNEKLHGANFCILSDGEQLRCAKRKALLKPGESFFGHEALIKRQREALLGCAAELMRDLEGLSFLLIRGELLGGGYPHPGVSALPGRSPVQTGVWYSPELEFCIFDLELIFQGGERSHLDFESAQNLIESAGLMFSSIRFKGSLNEALEQSPDFLTELPGRLSLPAIPENFAEGLVIRSLKPLYIQTRKGRARPMLKRKLPRFKEAHYHAATKPLAQPGLESFALDLLEWAALGMLNQNRLASASSKLGPLSASNQAAFERELSEDLWESLELEYPRECFGLPPDDLELLQALILDEIQSFLRQHC